MKTIMNFVFNWALVAALMVGGVGCRSVNDVAFGSDEVTAEQRMRKLGRLMFFDEGLSEPAGQACATCHAATAAFSDPRGGVTSRGVVDGRAGARNTPSAMYAALVPPLAWANDDDGFVGGLFLDGRADSLEAQAHQPMLNPIEMNNADAHAVADKLRRAPYAYLFRRTFGAAALDDDRAAFDFAAGALAAFERLPEFAPFTSKYDAFLAGTAELTAAEARGLDVFNDANKGNCAACHPSAAGDDGAPPLFTDSTYDNLGIPKNPANPFYAMAAFNPDGAAYLDRGLGAVLNAPAEDGKFRVPTLRNVALTAPYGHNGYFADLRAVVDFYNTRDTRPWPAAEVASTMNKDELGNLKLSDTDIDDLVAFMYTLSDGYAP
jgi:cytochrome c peroxidase